VCLIFSYSLLEQIAQVRPTLQATLMQRMTDVLARMLNDPATRMALGGVNDGQRAENAGRPEPPRPRFALLQSHSNVF